MRKTIFVLSFIINIFIYQSYAQDIKPGDNLIVDGIPTITTSLATDVKRYTEARGAGFASWHPQKAEMLITTRFGNTPQIHSVKMPLGTRSQLTFFDEPVSNAIYNPVNGDYFLFLKDVGGNEFSQIYRYDIKDRIVTLLTDGGRSQNGGIVWNKKGNLIAYSSTKRNGADRDIYIMDPLNPSSAKLILQVNGGGWSVLDWSPNDQGLLLSNYISVNESHYWILSLKNGEKLEITPEKEISYGTAQFSKDGKGFFFTTDKDNEYKRLAYMDLSDMQVQYLTSNIKWDVEEFSISENGSNLLFVTNEAGISKLYLLNTSTKKYLPITNIPIGIIGGYKWHKNNELVALTINSAKSTSDIYVLNIKTNKLERWTESELGGINPNQLSEPQLIKWKSFDDKEISGFYYKAASKFTDKRPVMINIHGGPEGQSFPTFQGRNNYFLNELGVAIIYPNVRGSTGYGKTFVKLDNGMLRENSVKDIGALIDWIAKQPELDAKRIMIMGGSYGGYMSLAVSAMYADRIRCAVDVVGISNFATFLQNTESYRRDLRRVEYGDERDSSMKAFFDKISPTNNVHKIKKSLFIVQGGNDPRVPRTEAVQMKEAVQKNGTPVWYLEAKDEGHGFRKKNNADFQFYSTILFMKKYLLE